MSELAYYPGTMGAGGRYTTGVYVSSVTEVDFYKGSLVIIGSLILALIFYFFWENRK